MVFTCKFHGFWPVGACAVIVAQTKKDAYRDMNATLKDMGLLATNPELEIEELDLRRNHVRVLLDGEY